MNKLFFVSNILNKPEYQLPNKTSPCNLDAWKEHKYHELSKHALLVWLFECYGQSLIQRSSLPTF